MSIETAPPPRIQPRRSTGDRLREALAALAEHRGQVVSHSEKPWASITFAGTRHRLAIVFSGDEAVASGERFVTELPEHEFALPGQLVADASVVEVEHRMVPNPRLMVQCELLLLEDG